VRPRAPIQIVVTPGSGDGAAVARARSLRHALASRGRAARLRAFDGLDDLRRWARTCAPTFSHLVAVGGDATLSAAAPAAIRTGAAFLPVPTGFGNVFAGVLGHPSDADAAVEVLEQGHVQWLDVGVAPDGVFLSHQSYGFLARVQRVVEHGRRQPRHRRARQLAYYRAAMRRFARGRFDRIRVEADGRLVAAAAALVTVANVTTYHGYLTLTPAASPADGRLDVCVIPRTTTARFVAQLLRLALELPGRWDGVLLRQARRVRVTVNRAAPASLRVAPAALPVLLPEATAARLAFPLPTGERAG